MRVVATVFALGCLLSCCACARTQAESKVRSSMTAAPATTNTSAATDPAKKPERIDFATQIKPIFQARCQPCHFNGGKVYEKMPFDRPETIRTLNTKLFTRIKDENERRLIRDFLAQE